MELVSPAATVLPDEVVDAGAEFAADCVFPGVTVGEVVIVLITNDVPPLGPVVGTV